MKNTSTQHSTSAGTRGRVLQGVVVKRAMKDTATVLVSRFVKHPKYKKYIRRSKKYLVHDIGNSAHVGDTVTIREVKPISKRKHFTLVERIKVAQAGATE